MCDGKQIISSYGLSLNEAKQELYIMLELMDCDLSYIISTRQVLTETHLKCFLKQMLEGLRAMHSLRILRTCHTTRMADAVGWLGSALTPC